MSRREAQARRVAADEVDDLLAPLAVLEAELFDDAWDAAALRDLAAGYGRHLHVVVTGALLEGYVLTQVLGDFVDLLRIGVAPAARRGGVATSLFAAACEAARAEGAERVLLEVSEANVGARAFYDRHGFVEIDRRPGYYRDGSDAIVLERPLERPPAAPTAADDTPTTGEGE